jgi:hypothetical protein
MDMADLEEKLKATSDARVRLVATVRRPLVI